MPLDTVHLGRPYIIQPHYFLEVLNLDLRGESDYATSFVAGFLRDADSALRQSAAMLPGRDDLACVFASTSTKFFERERLEAARRLANPLLQLWPRRRQAASDAVETCTSFLDFFLEHPEDLAPPIEVEYIHGYLISKSEFYFRWAGTALCFASRGEADFYRCLLTSYLEACGQAASLLSQIPQQTLEVAQLRNRLYELHALERFGSQ